MNNKTLFKWFSMLLLMMVAGISDAAAQSLGLADFSIKAGETKDVAITLTSESDVYGIQTDILLSEGLSLDGLETIQGLTLSNNEVNGAIRVSLLSLEGASIAAGDVITLKVKAASDFQRGTVSLTNSRITTDTKGTEVKAQDVTANVTLESAEEETDLLTSDMFFKWDGYGADAKKISAEVVDFNVGTEVKAGGMVAGTSTVDYLIYADLTDYTKMIFEGTPGMALRVLLNRQESNSGPLVEKLVTIGENGTAELDLSDLAYVHLNAIKSNWGSPDGTITAIKLVKSNTPKTYTVWLKNDAHWNAVYAYAWTTTGEEDTTVTKEFLGKWPGTAMTADPSATDLWKIEITDTEAPANIIFNSTVQGEQTADLVFENGKTYSNLPEDPWVDIVVNGNMEGESNECFYVTEQYVGGPYLAKITEGIGKDGSKAVMVQSEDEMEMGEHKPTDWNAQFFIRLPYQIPAGTPYRVSFDYKADKEGGFATQSHAEPGGYIHWACIGNGSFTTSWQTYKKEGTIDATMSPNNNMQTIAFNLAQNGEATQFVFDNVVFEIPQSVLNTLKPNPATNARPYPVPVEINSLAIVGTFIGGEATDTDLEPWWNPANGWQMTQDAEKPGTWTLTKEFTAEAKEYEYKATANGKWGDYELPDDGNFKYKFETAGDYVLTFKANTRIHALTLDVEEAGMQDFTATFTTNADWGNVYAYTWTDATEATAKVEQLGAWPGTKLVKNAETGVYDVKIRAKEAPAMIIFNNGNSGEGNQTADLVFEDKKAYEYTVEAGAETALKEAPEGWTLATTNGNLADAEDNSSYWMKEYPSTDIVHAAIVKGAGTNGSNGIKVQAGDDTNNTSQDGAVAWDSQFWIQLAEAVPSGTKVHVEFDYKASQAAKATTQAHGNPGAYQHWAAIGDVNFTTEWQPFSYDFTVDNAMAKGDNGNGSAEGLLTIAFNLQEEKSATDYYFDNFGVWYQKPLEIKSMTLVGDFLGLEVTDPENDPNWDLANGWEMTQDETNKNIWTVKKENFPIEAKTYYYKATANGVWGEYELPEKGNQNYVFNTAGNYDLTFTADTKNHSITLYAELKQNEGEEAPELVAPNGWTQGVTNGNLAGEDASSYWMKEYPDNAVVAAAIVAGAGKNNSRGILVKAGDDTANEGAQAWDSQFWIQLAEAVPEGTKVHVEFDYMASQAAKATTQAHYTPGAYQHWAAIGDVNFTTEWQHFSYDFDVTKDMTTQTVRDENDQEVTVVNGLLTIAFNLQEEKSATDYHFDNFGVWYQKPVEIESMAIVGELTGGWPVQNENTGEWDFSMAQEMTRDAENPAIWTLTVPFTAEDKTYQYKATANGKWGDYELPSSGNQNFTFGTEEYPAGEYNLTFTADTDNNTLKLDVKKASIKTFTATFNTNAPWPKVYAYAWTEDGENVTEFLGAWPGTELTAGADDVYTVTIEAEEAPAMIIFNNGQGGEGNQTEDLAFENEKAYEYVFTPTFDFENNNGNWAANLDLTTTPITMDGITLTGISGNVKIREKGLIFGNGSFKLTAPEGKNIKKVEIKWMAGTFNIGTQGYEPLTEKQKMNDEESIEYSVLAWTGQWSEVTFSTTARGTYIGYINVVLEDAAPATLAGDLNGDGVIDGFDIVAMVELIMAQGYKLEADLYPATAPDNVIDGFDLVALVDLIMAQPAPSHSPAMSALAEKPLTLTENKAGVKTLGIDAYEQFILTQMMVELADGMTLTGVTTDNRHTVAYRQLDDNKYMVLCYSAENAAFDSNANALTFHYTGNGEMKVNDALLISADKQGYRGTDVTSGSTTGISTIITNGQPFDVYTADGRLVKRGVTSTKGLSKGMYIINEQKIVVK